MRGWVDVALHHHGWPAATCPWQGWDVAVAGHGLGDVWFVLSGPCKIGGWVGCCSSAGLAVSAVTQTGLGSAGVPAATAIATAMTVATAIAIAIVLATPKSCAERVPKTFWSTDLFDQNLLV